MQKSNRYTLSVTLFLLFMSACKSVEQNVEGFWNFNYLFYKGDLIQLAGVGICFENDTCFLPGFYYSDTILLGKSCLNEYAKWEIVEEGAKKYSIVLRSENEIFNGKHSLKFVKFNDEKGNTGVKMILSSKNLYIEGTKLIVFKKPESYYIELVESTENSNVIIPNNKHL